MSEDLIVGYINFDRQSNQNNRVEALVTKNKIGYLRRNKFIKIVDTGNINEKNEYLGRVIEGPFFVPEEVSRDSAFAQISILHGDEIPIPPSFYATFCIEIIGKLDEYFKLTDTGTRPSPQSKIHTLTDEEINNILGLSQGDMTMGNLEGYENVLVKFQSDKINVLPRNLGIFGTVGSGKTNTAQVLIEELAEKGWSVVVLDVEGEYTEMNKPNDKVNEVKSLARFNMKAKGLTDFHVYKLCNQEGTLDAVDEVTITTKDINPYVLAEILGTTEPQTAGLFNIIDELKDNHNLSDGENVNPLEPRGGVRSGYTLNDLIEGINQKIASKSTGEVKTQSLFPLKRKLMSLLRTKAFDDKTAQTISPDKLMKSGRVTVFDLSFTGDQEKNLLIAQLLEKLFEAKIKDRNNEYGKTMIIIEEAHAFISRENKDHMSETMRMLKEIARRGRKRWLGLCFISQQPSHLPNEIFELSNTRIVHNIRSQKNLEVLKTSSGDVGEDTWDAVPGLSPGNAIVNGPQFRNSIVVKVRFPQTKRRKNE